jgi:hypothetical protein
MYVTMEIKRIGVALHPSGSSMFPAGQGGLDRVSLPADNCTRGELAQILSVSLLPMDLYRYTKKVYLL